MVPESLTDDAVGDGNDGEGQGVRVDEEEERVCCAPRLDRVGPVLGTLRHLLAGVVADTTDYQLNGR